VTPSESDFSGTKNSHFRDAVKKRFFGNRKVSFSWRPERTIFCNQKKIAFCGALKMWFLETVTNRFFATPWKSYFSKTERNRFSWRPEKAIFRKPKKSLIMAPWKSNFLETEKIVCFHGALISRFFGNRKNSLVMPP